MFEHNTVAGWDLEWNISSYSSSFSLLIVKIVAWGCHEAVEFYLEVFSDLCIIVSLNVGCWQIYTTCVLWWDIAKMKIIYIYSVYHTIGQFYGLYPFIVVWPVCVVRAYHADQSFWYWQSLPMAIHRFSNHLCFWSILLNHKRLKTNCLALLFFLFVLFPTWSSLIANLRPSCQD